MVLVWWCPMQRTRSYHRCSCHSLVCLQSSRRNLCLLPFFSSDRHRRVCQRNCFLSLEAYCSGDSIGFYLLLLIVGQSREGPGSPFAQVRHTSCAPIPLHCYLRIPLTPRKTRHTAAGLVRLADTVPDAPLRPRLLPRNEIHSPPPPRSCVACSVCVGSSVENRLQANGDVLATTVTVITDENNFCLA